MKYENSLGFAQKMDAADPLAHFRDAFHFPTTPNGAPIYLTGNSLGLQPKKAREYVAAEFDDWAALAVEGHFRAKHPWLPYHEFVTDMVARLVGAKPLEVVVMNTLTVNLHLMMVSFYRPTSTRYKILIEGGAFPSDQYAVASQLRFHGYAPETSLIELVPRAGELTLRHEDIVATIEREGDSIALVLIGNVNYLTGQAFDMRAITHAAHGKGCVVGFDLAHGAGNLHINLHDDGVDFAVWCSYKYLNGGPGAIAGCFVHERHATDDKLPRFSGWWGHDKKTRFAMGPTFVPIAGAEGWQLSNPPIFQLAALRASLELFDAATMPALRKKGDLLTGYLDFLLRDVSTCTIVTPVERGNQLSLTFSRAPKALMTALEADGVFVDFREPDVIRAAPAPLYNSFVDVQRFVAAVKKHTA